MKSSEMRVRIVGTTPLLGSISLDQEIATNFIASKAKTEEERARALEDMKDLPDDEVLEKSTTGFYRDANMNPILKGYQIKGFFKGAAKALKDQLKLANYASKIDNFVFISERNIPLMRDDKQITGVDGVLERPQRCETMQGPHVALARSEKIDEGWSAEFTVKVIKNDGTTRSSAVTMDTIRELLSYGEMKGLLQWRNAGFGSFTYEELEYKEND